MNKTANSIQASMAARVEARRFRRWFVDFQTELVIGGRQFRCQVCDLSPGGACVVVDGRVKFSPGTRLTFLLPGFGEISAEVVYVQHDEIGLHFRHDRTGELAVAGYLVGVEAKQDDHGETPDPIEAVIRVNDTEKDCLVLGISHAGAQVIVGDIRQYQVGELATLALPGADPVDGTINRVDDWEVRIAFAAAPKPSATPETNQRSWLGRARNLGGLHRFKRPKDAK